MVPQHYAAPGIVPTHMCVLEGLWQFPSQVMEPEQACQLEERHAAASQLLADAIGLPLADSSLAKHVSHIGTATHTFSHIQHIMYVDRLILKVHLCSHPARHVC